MSNLLAVRDLYKSFLEGEKEISILRGLDLDLNHGERLAVVGESGVRKSTLLHLIGTLDRPTKGEILYLDKVIPMDDETALSHFRNREIGFVFQFHYLLPDFSAMENVMMPAMIQRMDLARAQSEAERLLEMVGLKDRMSHRPGKLSGGEQQRVAVARSVILERKLILADEPNGSLDLCNVEGVVDLLFRLIEDTGIVWVVAFVHLDLAKIFRWH